MEVLLREDGLPGGKGRDSKEAGLRVADDMEAAGLSRNMFGGVRYVFLPMTNIVSPFQRPYSTPRHLEKPTPWPTQEPPPIADS